MAEKERADQYIYFDLKIYNYMNTQRGTARYYFSL